ncbi:uncharacterized protein LOC135926800 [Gordionus sp. m RMFG-2023]|uniref:uncharacterized protein LOC135926800 n=1 Tax=Gordionus sp. m RMFG-2023 TaxID=3053472 RepID=UPI0031FDA73E
MERSEDFNDWRWEEEKDDFRAILDEAVMEIPKGDLVIIGGDLNAHVGKARDSYKRHHNIERIDFSQEKKALYDDKTRYKKSKRLATKAVTRAKSMAYDDMYEDLHTKEGQNKIYRLAKQREKNSRDINVAPIVIINKDGKLIIKEKEIMNRWKEYFLELLNFNPHILHLDEHSQCQNLVQPITEQEIITCLKHMENNKARGPDDIPIESLKALGDDGIHLLTNLYNKI